MNARDDFYVGYLAEAPPALGAWLGRAAAALTALAVVAAAAAAAGHARLDAAHFAYGRTVALEGVVRERPVPLLEVARPGAVGRLPERSRYLLVAPGKHGAAGLVAGRDGRRVRLRGTVAWRDDVPDVLVEVLPGSIAPVATAPGDDTAAQGAELGLHALVGEIVDGKCFLGVMVPGDGATHRACASLCIRGGIPPLFVVRDASDRLVALVLVDADGGAVNARVLGMVGEPLAITGRVTRHDDLLVLAADPAGYRRLVGADAARWRRPIALDGGRCDASGRS